MCRKGKVMLVDDYGHHPTEVAANIRAIRDGWPLEWGKPEVLAPYLLKAVPVTVLPNSRGSQKIEEGVPVQGR